MKASFLYTRKALTIIAFFSWIMGASLVSAAVDPKQQLINDLVMAAAREDTPDDKIESLIAKGADVNGVSTTGFVGGTPLVMAAQLGRLPAVKILIKHRADVNKGAFGSGTTPLANAATNGNLDIVNVLLQNGANPKQQDTYGYAPIHGAAMNNNVSIMESLIQKGADINVQDKDGDTPLHWAAQWGRVDAIKVLIAHGVKRGVRNNKGQTPVQVATGAAKEYLNLHH